LQESRNHAGNFLEAVRRRSDPVSDIEEAVYSDNISQVSDIAIRSGRKIVWDPVKEEIIGDEQATRRLSQPPSDPRLPPALERDLRSRVGRVVRVPPQSK